MASDLPKRTDAVCVRCTRCKSTNTVVELYDTTGPEGRCLMCPQTFQPTVATLEALVKQDPAYQRYLPRRRAA